MWLYHSVMSPKDADGIANSVDPDQTPQSSLILVCTVCPDLYVRKLRIITVFLFTGDRRKTERNNARVEYAEVKVRPRCSTPRESCYWWTLSWGWDVKRGKACFFFLSFKRWIETLLRIPLSFEHLCEISKSWKGSVLQLFKKLLSQLFSYFETNSQFHNIFFFFVTNLWFWLLETSLDCNTQFFRRFIFMKISSLWNSKQ